jgi:predicted HicB family RNase H-like nuclease
MEKARVIAVRVSEDLHRILEEMARKNALSISAQVRLLVVTHLAEGKEGDEKTRGG